MKLSSHSRHAEGSDRRPRSSMGLGAVCLGLVLASFARSAAAQDTDQDGLPDAWERGFGRYEVILGSFTWEQASLDARARNGHLATVIHRLEWEDLKTVLGSALTGKNLWLGGTDEGNERTWRWVTGEAWRFENWRPGQPDNDSLGNGAGTPENYLIIWGRELPAVEAPFAYWNDVTLSGSILARDGYVLERGTWTNIIDADSDFDGLTDAEESPLHAPYVTSTDPNTADSDADFLSDGLELKAYHTDPANPDTDEDGLSDGGEILNWQTNPFMPDTDGDGLLDGRELFVLQTNPLKPDTDGDTFSDAEEVAAGTNPRDPNSSLIQRHREYTAVEVEFQALVGVSYQLQALTPAGSWESVGGKITGTGASYRLLLSTREAPMKMWRVILAK